MASTSGVVVQDEEEQKEKEEKIDANDDENAKEVEKMRRKLIKCMTSNWKEVIKIYEQDPRAHKITLGKSGNTALHMAVASGEEDVVQELVKLINDKSENPFEVLSIRGGDWGSNPLHLAASMGSVQMCRCIIGDEHKQLMATRNYFLGTPMYMAVYHAKKNTFLWLYEMCENFAQAYQYCRANHDITVLHIAIANGYWDLALQIILRLPSLMDSVNGFGNSPLHVLAQSSTAFPSGISLGIFERLVYRCIYVEELVPDYTSKEEKQKGLEFADNYRTCINFFQMLWKMIKLVVNGGKGKRKSNKQLDTENPEGRQGYHSSTRGQGHGVIRKLHDRILNYIGLILSKMVKRSIVVGSSEIRTLRGIKETHIWSAQITDKLLEHAAKFEDEANPQNCATTQYTCYSEYDVFRRDKAFQTPIICASMNGIVELVEKMLEVFPMTIHDRDNQGRNIILAAVEFRQSHVYDFILKRKSYVVDKDLAFCERDTGENTVMHRAAMLENIGQNLPITMLQLQWEVKWYEYVKNTLPPNFYVGTNSQDKYPMQIFTETHEKLLIKSRSWLNDRCNACSVIAALIATLAFASSATVPGGVNQDSNSKDIGQPILQHHLAFKIFAMSSLVALCCSFLSLLIFFAILMSKHEYKDFCKSLPRNLILGLTFLIISMAAMLLCFSSGHFLMLDHRLKCGAVPVYAVTILAVTYFSLRQFPAYFVLFWSTFKNVPQPGLIHHQDPFQD